MSTETNMDAALLRDLASAALAAPSADNRHRFRLVAASARTLNVVGEGDLFTSMPRHRQVLTLFSLGAVVENIVLRAGERSFRAEIRWFPEGNGPLVASIDLEPDVAGPGHGALAAAIHDRHTNRRMYTGPRLTAEERDALDQACGLEGVHLEWLSGVRRRAVHSLIWKAETERFRRPALHEELFGSIRFDLDWHASTDDGLPPAALEVEAPMRPMFKAMRHWSLMRSLSWVGTHYILGIRAGLLPCAQAPELAVISSDLPLDQAAVQSGRSFQRLWLQASSLGLALQPMAASAVLPLQSDVPGGMAPAVRERISAEWRALQGERLPMMVFRLGRAPGATARTLRPPVESVL